MQKKHELASLEEKTDAEIALTIHYLDPEFNAGGTGKDDGNILVRSVRWLTEALTRICLYMKTL